MLETIEIVGAGANTISVVKEAIALKEKRKNIITLPEYDQVWAVFDRDSFPAHNVNKACLMAENEGIDCAFSNEAFELWYLLHFEYLNTSISRGQYVIKLSSILSGIFKKKMKYEKNDADIYSILEKHGDQKQAIKFAKKLKKESENLSYAESNPSTSVFLLVEILNDYLG